MNKDEKYLGKDREITHSIYGFIVEDWLRALLDKPIKDEGVDLNREDLE